MERAPQPPALRPRPRPARTPSPPPRRADPRTDGGPHAQPRPTLAISRVRGAAERPEGDAQISPMTVSLVPAPKYCSYTEAQPRTQTPRRPSRFPLRLAARTQRGKPARCRAGKGPGAAAFPPDPAATHPRRSAGCRARRSGRRLQSTAPGPPPRSPPRRAPRSPSTDSRVPAPKYWVFWLTAPRRSTKTGPPCPGPTALPGAPAHPGLPSTVRRVPLPKY